MSPQMKYKSAKPQNTSTMNNSCEVTLLQLQQMNFALVDLNLYLDMYPDNAQAVEDYMRFLSNIGRPEVFMSKLTVH